MATKVGNLVVEMSANVARLQRDFNKASRQAQGVARKFKSIFKGLGLSIAAGLSVKALSDVVKSSIDAADALAKQAAKANIATDTFQELTFALDKFDVSQEMAASGLAAFTKRLGEARAGTGALTTFLKKYDQSLLDSLVSAESNEKALNIFMDALGKVKNDADRAAMSAAAFSRSAGIGMASAFKDGGKALDEWRKKVRSLGLVVDETLLRQAEDAKDQMAALSQVIKTRAVVAVAEIAPQISQLAETLAKMVPDLQDFAKAVADIAEFGVDAAGAVKELDDYTGGWLSEIKDNLPVIREFKLLLNAIRLYKGGTDRDQAAARGATFGTIDWSTYDGGDGSSGGATSVANTAEEVIKSLQFEQEQLNRLVADGATEVEVYNQLKKAGVSINSAAGRQIAVLVRAIESEKEAHKDAEKAAEDHDKAIVEMMDNQNALAQRAADIYEATRTPFEKFQEQIKELQYYRDIKLIDNETYSRALNKLTKDYASTVEKIKDKTAEWGVFAQEAFRSMQNIASDFFFDALNGDFDDLGDSFRNMVNRMLADWASVKLMGSLFGNDFGSTGELGGIVGSIFGGFRAGGGDVAAGKAYVVGENGPEVYIPQTSGSIISNSNLGGTSITVPIGNIDGGNKQFIAMLPEYIRSAVIEAMRDYS